MNTNIFALASALSDHDLLARIGVLAGKEREATVELVAHLAALDARPTLFAAAGHGSLFTYCTEVKRVGRASRSEEHTSELQSRQYLVCRLLLEKKTSDNS